MPAKDLDFQQLYKDKLPQDAIELEDFVKSIKNNNGGEEEKTEEKIAVGHWRLNQIKDLVPGGKRESLYKMVSDVIPNAEKKKDSNKVDFGEKDSKTTK